MDGGAILERDVLMCYVFLILADVSVIYLAYLFVYALVGLQGGIYVGVRGNRLVFVVIPDDVTYALGVDGEAGCKVNGIERAVRTILADVSFVCRQRGIHACVRKGGIGICSTDNIKKGFLISTYGDAGIESSKIPGAVRLVFTDILVFKRFQFVLNPLVGLQGGIYVGVRGHRLVFVVVADNIVYALGVDG